MPRVQATYRARIAFPATRSNPPAQQIAAATCLSPAITGDAPMLYTVKSLLRSPQSLKQAFPDLLWT